MNATPADTANIASLAPPHLSLDFVSDIACPWCAVGLAALEKAMGSVSGELKVELRFQPFELNPAMPPGGEDIVEHLVRKYQITPAQIEQNQQHLYQRGAEAGFAFTPGARFFLDGSGDRMARLSFSSLPARRIDDGVRRLVDAVGEWRRGRHSRPGPDRVDTLVV